MLYNNIGGQSRKLWSELSQKVQEDSEMLNRDSDFVKSQ